MKKLLNKLKFAVMPAKKDEETLLRWLNSDSEKEEKAEPDKKEQEDPSTRPLADQVIKRLSEIIEEHQQYPCVNNQLGCQFKRSYMPLFEKDNMYIHIAFNKQGGVANVCGLVAKLEHARKKDEMESTLTSNLPDCKVSEAIADVFMLRYNKQCHIIKKDPEQIAIDSMLVLNTEKSDLKKNEREWLKLMATNMNKEEFDILEKLLIYTIRRDNFKETLDVFLRTKKELIGGSCQSVVLAFNSLINDFPLGDEDISIANIGEYLQHTHNLDNGELIRTLIELFFCMGYEKEINGYATGFVDIKTLS